MGAAGPVEGTGRHDGGHRAAPRWTVACRVRLWSRADPSGCVRGGGQVGFSEYCCAPWFYTGELQPDISLLDGEHCSNLRGHDLHGGREWGSYPGNSRSVLGRGGERLASALSGAGRSYRHDSLAATPDKCTLGRVEVKEVCHEYLSPTDKTPVAALGPVSLQVSAGEFLCLLGPSGCGKSTLLMIIAGLFNPTAGTVVVDGVAVTGPSRERGVVFQDYALLPWKTVRSNVALGPRLAGASRREANQVADEFLELVGMPQAGDRYPHELSGGMRQRAAVARTLAAKPKVLLMDEPFAAVDAQTRGVLQEELIGIWARTAQTVVFVTHSVEEAALLADRVVVMSTGPGRVQEEFPVTLPHEDRFSRESATRVAEVAASLLASVRTAQPRRPRRGGSWSG